MYEDTVLDRLERTMEEPVASYEEHEQGAHLYTTGRPIDDCRTFWERIGWKDARDSAAYFAPTFASGWQKYENGLREGDCTPGPERNGWWAALHADATCDMPAGYCDALGI